MARKERIITIQDRDEQWTFKIREMSAIELESWMLRLVQLLGEEETGSGQDPDLRAVGKILSGGGLAALSRLPYRKLKELLDEMLGCCYRMLGEKEERCTPQSVDSYIQEATSLLRLRLEAATLNLGFLYAAGRKRLRLPRESRYKHATDNKQLAEYANISSKMGAVLNRGLASKWELETRYSYPDLLDFMEIIIVDNYNNWVVREDGQRK